LYPNRQWICQSWAIRARLAPLADADRRNDRPETCCDRADLHLTRIWDCIF
jgi:hypothetical protein